MPVEQKREWMGRAKDLWCEVFHNKPMWPVNGRYQCGSCLRYHAVRWENAAAQTGTKHDHTCRVAEEAFNLNPAVRSESGGQEADFRRRIACIVEPVTENEAKHRSPACG